MNLTIEQIEALKTEIKKMSASVGNENNYYRKKELYDKLKKFRMILATAKPIPKPEGEEITLGSTVHVFISYNDGKSFFKEEKVLLIVADDTPGLYLDGLDSITKDSPLGKSLLDNKTIGDDFEFTTPFDENVNYGTIKDVNKKDSKNVVKQKMLKKV